MTRFSLQRLDHVSLNVRDREASIAWYRAVLGLEQRNPATRADRPVFMGDFGRCVALFQAAVESPERAVESIGLRHPAFSLGRADLELAREHVQANDLAFRFEDHGNAHSLYLPDPDGNVVELTSYDV